VCVCVFASVCALGFSFSLGLSCSLTPLLFCTFSVPPFHAHDFAGQKRFENGQDWWCICGTDTNIECANSPRHSIHFGISQGNSEIGAGCGDSRVFWCSKDKQRAIASHVTRTQDQTVTLPIDPDTGMRLRSNEN